MKKIVIFTLVFMSYLNVQSESSCWPIPIPKHLVKNQATLFLCMQDCQGKQLVGKLHLDSSTPLHVVQQQELEMTTCDEVLSLSTATVDLLEHPTTTDTSVVVYFELDSAVKMVHILVLKDCLLDADPFEVLSVSFDDLNVSLAEEEEKDELSEIAAHIDHNGVHANNVYWLHKYIAYAKIVALMQYEKVQHAVRKVSSWWN